MAQGASLGLTLGASLVVFAYLGYRLDLWLDSSPFGLVAGCLLGLAGGVIHVVRRVQELESAGRDGPEAGDDGP